jgi:hypothetical protein
MAGQAGQAGQAAHCRIWLVSDQLAARVLAPLGAAPPHQPLIGQVSLAGFAAQPSNQPRSSSAATAMQRTGAGGGTKEKRGWGLPDRNLNALTVTPPDEVLASKVSRTSSSSLYGRQSLA